MSYPNWKLGEKKDIKSAKSQIEGAMRTITSKLGGDWEVVIDWGKFGELIDSSSSYRKKPSKSIVEKVISQVANVDVGAMEQDVADTVNKLCSTKKLTITAGPKSGNYNHRRAGVSIEDSGVVMKWNIDYIGYTYDKDYINLTVCDMPGAAASPPYPGNWTLKELKDIDSKKSQCNSACKSIDAKLGGGWTVEVDWAAAANYIDMSSSYRNSIGKALVEKVIQQVANADVSCFDEDVVEAAVDMVGDTKKFTITFGPKSASYSHRRANIEVDDSKGIVIKWNCDYIGYTYDKDYINQWVLENA